MAVRKEVHIKGRAKQRYYLNPTVFSKVDIFLDEEFATPAIIEELQHSAQKEAEYNLISKWERDPKRIKLILEDKKARVERGAKIIEHPIGTEQGN